MLYPYYLLIIAWLIFGLLHSVLAADFIKEPAKRILKQGYKFYRLGYSLFAILSLLAVLYYHFTSAKILLWQPPLMETAVAVFFVLTGLGIMLVCIKKYFLDLSGIDAILGTQHSTVLQLNGLHKYVRHPLYFGTLLFVWALFFWYPYTNNLVSCICITLYTIAGMWFEEKKLVIEYGEAYRDYQKKTAALVPWFI